MYEITKVHDISILHLFGEISLLECELIEKLFNSFKKHQHNKIILDLSQVDHIHFKAVEQWAVAAKELQERSGGLKIASAKKEAQNIFKFTGADQSMEDYSTAGEAILSFLAIPDPEVSEFNDLKVAKKDKKSNEALVPRIH